MGEVWASIEPTRVNTADGQPMAHADGIHSAIEMVVVVPGDSITDLGDGCREAIRGSGDPAAQCLYVQWSFDVSADFRVDDNSPSGSLNGEDLVTADGKQVSTIFAESGFPGSRENRLSVFYPAGGLGSTVRWSTGSNLVGYTTSKYVVPNTDLPPIYF